jgi:transglutaminase-like putative cysteine protease
VREAGAIRRTLVLSVAAAAFVGLSWLRLEEPGDGGRLALVIALAVAPAVLPGTRWRLAALVPALALAAAVAFDDSPFASLDHAQVGLRSFYDVALPFDPGARPEMHGLVLLAAYAFATAVALAIAERRAIAAAAAFVAGAGWPLTLVPGNAELGQGALILAGALVLLAAVHRRSLAGPGRVVVAGSGVVVAALVAASLPAVARDQIVGWETWDPYARSGPPVGVQYVWDSSYAGIDFPSDPTNLLEIAAPGNPTYWRATTLDVFRNDHWHEELHSTSPIATAERTELTADPDLPAAARRRARWIEQQVRVTGLRDTHLVGAPVPVAFAAEDDDGIDFSAGGIAEVDGGVERGFRYSVWSYAPSPSPRRLAGSPPRYEPELATAKYLEVERNVTVPPFGVPGRHARMLELIRGDRGVGQYEPLYRLARRVGGSATPYGAVVALETWFRTNSQFVYEEQPQRWPAGVPPLVDFVTRTREGYCQHYAGAMALMLRYLGIPARVAAGFTSGSYDVEEGTWTVTDRNAHTWVEVWFRGYGWLPFDPTPGRGRLAGPYTSSSLGFRGREALEALGVGGAGLGAEGRRVLNRLNRLLARERALDPPAQVSGDSGAGDGSGDLTLALLLLAGLTGVTALAVAKLVRRRVRYVGGGARRIASACRLELADFARDQRVDIRPAATLEELGEKVRRALSVDTGRFVEAASVARFGPDAIAEDAARTARRELSALKRRIRARLSTRRRLSGLVSLRSLRA